MTLFGFFCALLFLTYRLGSFLTKPLSFAVENESVLRSKKRLKKTQSSETARKKVVSLFFFFFLCLHINRTSRVRGGGGCVVLAKFSFRLIISSLFLSLSLGSLYIFPLSRRRRRGVLSPHTTPICKEEVFVLSVTTTQHIYYTTTRKEREREREGKEVEKVFVMGAASNAGAETTPPNDPNLRANEDAMRQIMHLVFSEIKPFVTQHEPDVPEEDLPELSRTRDLSKADFTVQWSRFCAKRKLNPAEYVKNLSETIQKQIEDGAHQDGFIKSVQGVGPYMNIFVKRQKVFKLAINAIIEQGTKYGCTNAGQGKKVIIEHTSSNPNAPLHIGNLRNVMIGAHLARVMQACGCEVTQAFYVNDLGAQIGLTALAYSRIYTKIKPTMKIDQWIGAMYAVMNTCQELQQVGVQPGDLEVRLLFSLLVSFVSFSSVLPSRDQSNKE